MPSLASVHTRFTTLTFTSLVMMLIMTGCSQETPQALGTLERDRIAHTATAAEVVTALPVRQGERVKKGTVIVVLDTHKQSAKVERAKAEVAHAQANLDKLHNGARPEEVAAAQALAAGARASLADTEKTLARQQSMFKRNLTSEASLDNARATRDIARSQLENAQEKLRVLTNGTREEDLRIGAADLAAAQSTLTFEAKSLDDLTVTASRDGILDSLPWNLGERVTLGSPVAVILAGESPYARVYIPEPFRVGIKIGTSLTVRVDGVEDLFTGKVRWISHEPAYSPYYALNQSERSRLVYLAEVQMAEEASQLPSGLPVQVLMP